MQPATSASESKSASLNWTAILVLSLLLLIAGGVFLARPFLSPRQATPVMVPSTQPPPQIQDRKYTSQEHRALRKRFWELRGDEKICAHGYVDRYARAAYDYCEATDGGKDVGGGCGHLTGGLFMYTPLLDIAMTQCKVGHQSDGMA